MSSPNPSPLLPSPSPRDPEPKSRSPSPAVEQRPDSPRPDDGPADPEQPYPEAPYIEPSSTTLLPPPNFNPFFTLIEDETGEHYHPSIHYIFADDDPILLTAASMRALGVDETTLLADPNAEGRQGDGDEEDDGIRESPLPPPLPGVMERYLIIDVGNDGQSITDAQSLSTEWQVTSTSVRPAPSWDEEAGAEGLMLMVGGLEIAQAGKKPGQPGEMRLQEARAACGGDVLAGMESIVAGFDKDLETLKRVVGEEQQES